MSATSSSLIVPTDPQLASAIIANMLENWLDSSPHALTTPEVTDEPENLRTAEEQTGLHLCASVDPCASAPPSGEHRASVCAAAESSRTGLERTVDPHPRSGFGNIRCPHDGAHGLQDPGSGCSQIPIEDAGRRFAPAQFKSFLPQRILTLGALLMVAHLRK